ncbi:MAG: hypothetical protein IIU85_03000 [Rikenellaceae bacterium]|nr:hypothetical protein [Rikenellaceae bacterium]
MFRKLLISIMLIAAGTLGARAQQFDRGIETGSTVFVPKGQWIVGGNISYSTHDNENYKFLIVENINSTGYNFKVSPMVAYAFKDNMALGLRGGYNRQLLKINNADLNLSEDMNLGVSDYYSLKHTATGSAIYRYYITLGQSKRFALFNEMQLTYGHGQSKLVDSSGAAVTGTYETTNDFAIGCSPGLVAFITNSAAVEVNVGVLGFNYSHTKQVTDQVYVGYRKASQMNFKVNIFSIALGIAFYL